VACQGGPWALRLARQLLGPRPLGGEHLWTPRPDSQVFLTVTEGKLDCLSVAEAQACKYPVVSIPGGNTAAKRVVAEEIEWLERFPWVVFAFDMDEPGQRAARECAEQLTPGKARIARLPLNDPNRCASASARLAAGVTVQEESEGRSRIARRRMRRLS
jgi:DNA primase